MATGKLVRQLEAEAIELLARADVADERADEIEASLNERVAKMPEDTREWCREMLFDLIHANRELANQRRRVAEHKNQLASEWGLLLVSAGLGITHGKAKT